MSQQLSQLIAGSEAKRQELERHHDELKRSLDNKQTFSLDSIKSTLEGDLDLITNYVLDLSKSCLKQLTDWNRTLIDMDTEFVEVAGLVQCVKSDAGSRAMGPVLAAGSAYASQQPDVYVQQVQCINIPLYPFDINTNALDNVGHKPEDIRPDGAPLKPLVVPIPPGEPLPYFWSCPQDFFAPEKGQSLPDSEYMTTFADFYGFNPINGSQC